MERTVAHVEAQNDCTDFGLHALIPMLYRHGEDGSGVRSEELESNRAEAVLSSVYWYDEPGVHEIWFSTENHQVLWHAAELLVGQRYPGERFGDGRTGA